MAIPMAAPSAGAASSPDLFLFIVDGSNVMRAVAGVMDAVSAPNLAAWMQAFVVEGYFQNQIKERFDKEGDRVSGKWPALESATENIRTYLGFPASHPINERTGKLREFVTSSSDIVVTPDSVTAQIPGAAPDPVTLRKLEVAQKGTDVNPLKSAGSTPARPVLGMDTADVAAVLTSLQYAIIANVEMNFGPAAAVF